MAKPGQVVNVDEMSGHCVGFPASMMQRVGSPNINRFPHYHGDSMYILRAVRAGFPAYLLGSARVEHLGHIKSTVADFLVSCKSQSLLIKFNTLFWQKRSLYFLPTQFFYFLEKCGVVRGSWLFSKKIVRWSLEVLQPQWFQS